MIGFKTVYEPITETEMYVSSATLADEAYNPKGENMYQVDLMPFDEENTAPLFNVPLMVDYSNGTPKYYIPDLSEYIDSEHSYNFDDVSSHKCIEVKLNGDMLVIEPVQADKGTISLDTTEDIDRVINALENLKKKGN